MPHNDPHYSSAYWRAIRELCLARDGHRCRLCNSADALQAHHRTYDRFGKEELDDLTTLCEPCHDVVTDHQRRLRYTTRELPPVREVATPLAVYVFGSSYQEIVLETNREISPYRGSAALDAQWPTERSAQRMDQGQEKDHGQAQENRGRSRGSLAPRMDGWSLSVQWSAMYSARGHQGDIAAGRLYPEKRTESEAGTDL